MDTSAFVNNSLSNMIFRSVENWKVKDEKSYILGIDEAGRGPVLGLFTSESFLSMRMFRR